MLELCRACLHFDQAGLRCARFPRIFVGDPKGNLFLLGQAEVRREGDCDAFAPPPVPGVFKDGCLLAIVSAIGDSLVWLARRLFPAFYWLKNAVTGKRKP